MILNQILEIEFATHLTMIQLDTSSGLLIDHVINYLPLHYIEVEKKTRSFPLLYISYVRYLNFIKCIMINYKTVITSIFVICARFIQLKYCTLSSQLTYVPR